MVSNSCEFCVGRLLEIKVARGYRSVEDVDDMIAMIGDRVSKLPAAQRYVIAADWRNVTVMSPETATRARAMLTKSNARVERSAILTNSEQSMTNLQVQRLVREAENEDRRHFISARATHAWLSEVLTHEESVRLAEFLGVSGSPRLPSG